MHRIEPANTLVEAKAWSYNSLVVEVEQFKAVRAWTGEQSELLSAAATTTSDTSIDPCLQHQCPPGQYTSTKLCRVKSKAIQLMQVNTG